MSTLRRLLILFPLLGLAFSACGTSTAHRSAPPVPADTIVIRNFAFSPATLTVAPGATVTVRNEDQSTHTLTATDKAFDTGNLSGGATATFKAPSRPGRYPYICEMHQYMAGSLIVS